MRTKQTKTTTEPPRWVRPPADGHKLHGFSRGALYQAERQGLIETSRIRLSPDSRRTIFLVNENSVLALIQKNLVKLA